MVLSCTKTMEVRFSEAGVFKKIVDGMREMITETNLDCSSDGMTLQCMDSNHVALVSLQLYVRAFVHYTCKRDLSIGINVNTLWKMLKCGNNDDILTLAYDDGDILTLMFESPNGSSISDFQMKLMDIDTEQLGIPETEWAASVTMPSAEFQRICKDMAVIGDTLSIYVDRQCIKFSVNGEMGTGNTTLMPGGETITMQCVQEVGTLTFALRYLNLFTKATPLADTVTLHLSENVPLLVEYTIRDMGRIQFYLAPKMDEHSTS